MKVNFYISDQSIIDHLNKQDNKSKYLCRLIQEDIKNNHQLTKEEIIKLIEQYTKPNEIKETIFEMFEK